MLPDLRFAFRQFLKTPGFSVIAVLTLALAIGANVAMFSAIDAVLLHPLPYPDPDRLVMVGENLTHFNLTKIPSSAPEVMDYRRMVTSLAQIGVVNTDGGFTLTGDGNRGKYSRRTGQRERVYDTRRKAGGGRIVYGCPGTGMDRTGSR